jgi:hypothetical protein
MPPENFSEDGGGMSPSDDSRLDPAELAQLLQAADPAALLAPPRLVRRAIKQDRRWTGIGLRVPHARSYVIGRDALLALATRAELGVAPDRELPEKLILIASPDPTWLGSVPRAQALVDTWRLLFHARIHLAMATQFDERNLGDAGMRERIERIGPLEFDEIAAVLRQEKLLLPPRDERTIYEEFAAVYWELRYFAPALLPRYFPALRDRERVEQVLAEDVDAGAVFAAARLAGAPDPMGPTALVEQAVAPKQESAATRDGEWCRRLAGRADYDSARGNSVRAAIRLSQAAHCAPSELDRRFQASAADALDRLIQRLQAVLHFDEAEATKWRRSLAALLAPAAAGFWTAEARLLYDLQKICVDHERPIYALDLVEWAYSLFRQPFVRPLPNQPALLAVKHLRVALGRVPAIQVTEAVRHELSGLLHGALHQAEVTLRARWRPALGDALREVGLQPQNFPERVALDKLIEELLDQIIERGFLNLGDLRDALSRNELKLADLSGAGEFFVGDPLIRANRELAVRAAGIYRRGEIYLRWLQRASALTFGTRPGRWLTRFLLLPFGGAFATIIFIQEMLKLVRLPHHLHEPTFGLTLGALGIFYLLLMHVPAFRALVVRGFQTAWRGARALFVDLPAALLRVLQVRWFFGSRLFLFLVRYLLKPLPAALLAWAILTALGVESGTAMAGAGATLVIVSFVLNSRFGRDLEEITIDWFVRNWEYVRSLVPGLFRLVMGFFHGILEETDRVLYSVDEWLRFRHGQGRWTFAAKIVLGFIWFIVTYVIRLYVNVFIEPTVNPLKHFPVVTVAAKLLVPFWKPLLEFLAAPLLFLGPLPAYSIAFLTLHAIPGVAGFLVWELKENWKLYRANRARALGPVVIGSHGETMIRLLRPGFHSGTLPKLYARIRRALHKAQRTGDWERAQRLEAMLHHVEQSIGHFSERELLAFVNGAKSWRHGPIHLSGVATATNRIILRFACPSLGERDMEMSFEEQSGVFWAHVAKPGWRMLITGAEAEILSLAIIGFYKKAGVDRVREDTEDQVPFKDRAIAWQDWVAAWESDQSGNGQSMPVSSIPLVQPS